MKYCPYCGAGFSDGTVSFCSECGKKLPEEKAVPPEAKEQSKKVAKKQKRKKEKKEKHMVFVHIEVRNMHWRECVMLHAGAKPTG